MTSEHRPLTPPAVAQRHSPGGRARPLPPAVLTAAAVTAAGLAVVHAGPGLTALGPVRRRLFPRLAGLGRGDHVALTFDDGPDPASTPAFLDLLATRRVRATFFLLGSMVMRAPGLVGDIIAAGHEVGVHGWEHRYAVLRAPRAVLDDMRRARDAVVQAGAVTPRFYRPPYGVLTGASLAAARRLDLTPVLWTCWGQEWRPGATAQTVYRTVSGNLGGGSCVLLHDSDCTSPAGSAAAALGALPRLLDRCAAEGLTVGPLAEHGL